MYESDHDQYQPSVHVAERALKVEYDKIWEIQLQGLYDTTREGYCLNIATWQCLGVGGARLLQAFTWISNFGTIILQSEKSFYPPKLIAWARQNC